MVKPILYGIYNCKGKNNRAVQMQVVYVSGDTVAVEYVEFRTREVVATKMTLAAFWSKVLTYSGINDMDIYVLKTREWDLDAKRASERR